MRIYTAALTASTLALILSMGPSHAMYGNGGQPAGSGGTPLPPPLPGYGASVAAASSAPPRPTPPTTSTSALPSAVPIGNFAIPAPSSVPGPSAPRRASPAVSRPTAPTYAPSSQSSLSHSQAYAAVSANVPPSSRSTPSRPQPRAASPGVSYSTASSGSRLGTSPAPAARAAQQPQPQPSTAASRLSQRIPLPVRERSPERSRGGRAEVPGGSASRGFASTATSSSQAAPVNEVSQLAAQRSASAQRIRKLEEENKKIREEGGAVLASAREARLDREVIQEIEQDVLAQEARHNIQKQREEKLFQRLNTQLAALTGRSQQPAPSAGPTRQEKLAQERDTLQRKIRAAEEIKGQFQTDLQLQLSRQQITRDQFTKQLRDFQTGSIDPLTTELKQVEQQLKEVATGPARAVAPPPLPQPVVAPPAPAQPLAGPMPPQPEQPRSSSRMRLREAEKEKENLLKEFDRPDADSHLRSLILGDVDGTIQSLRAQVAAEEQTAALRPAPPVIARPPVPAQLVARPAIPEPQRPDQRQAQLKKHDAEITQQLSRATDQMKQREAQLNREAQAGRLTPQQAEASLIKSQQEILTPITHQMGLLQRARKAEQERAALEQQLRAADQEYSTLEFATQRVFDRGTIDADEVNRKRIEFQNERFTPLIAKMTEATREYDEAVEAMGKAAAQSLPPQPAASASAPRVSNAAQPPAEPPRLIIAQHHYQEAQKLVADAERRLAAAQENSRQLGGNSQQTFGADMFRQISSLESEVAAAQMHLDDARADFVSAGGSLGEAAPIASRPMPVVAPPAPSPEKARPPVQAQDEIGDDSLSSASSSRPPLPPIPVPISVLHQQDPEHFAGAERVARAQELLLAARQDAAQANAAAEAELERIPDLTPRSQERALDKVGQLLDKAERLAQEQASAEAVYAEENNKYEALLRQRAPQAPAALPPASPVVPASVPVLVAPPQLPQAMPPARPPLLPVVPLNPADAPPPLPRVFPGSIVALGAPVAMPVPAPVASANAAPPLPVAIMGGGPAPVIADVLERERGQAVVVPVPVPVQVQVRINIGDQAQRMQTFLKRGLPKSALQRAQEASSEAGGLATLRSPYLAAYYNVLEHHYPSDGLYKPEDKDDYLAAQALKRELAELLTRQGHVPCGGRSDDRPECRGVAPGEYGIR